MVIPVAFGFLLFANLLTGLAAALHAFGPNARYLGRGQVVFELPAHLFFHRAAVLLEDDVIDPLRSAACSGGFSVKNTRVFRLDPLAHWLPLVGIFQPYFQPSGYKYVKKRRSLE
jgi:hypothetical protein